MLPRRSLVYRLDFVLAVPGYVDVEEGKDLKVINKCHVAATRSLVLSLLEPTKFDQGKFPKRHPLPTRSGMHIHLSKRYKSLQIALKPAG